MTEEDIGIVLENYVKNNELSGASLLVRRGDDVLYEGQWGYSDIENNIEISNDSIYRMMSMTKCITAAAVMICVERGQMTLDTPICNILPEFQNMQVMDDKRYVFSAKKMKKIPFMLLTFSMNNVRRKPAARDITVRDLLSHSSGLQQGLAGLLDMLKDRRQYFTLEEWVNHFSSNVLDFEPGAGTGYSPVAGFDILAYIVAKLNGCSFEEFVQREICVPLNMENTTFFLNDEQKKYLVKAYRRRKNKLIDVTGTKKDIAGFYHSKQLTFEHGSGGIYSTLKDYDRFGHMLLNNGELDGVRILKEETAALMHTEAPEKHLEPEPGFVWGLGMKIRQDPSKSECKAAAGTYGWSGAFGTHFFISPADNIECVFMTNRTDLNGSGSYISAKIEEMVFRIWGNQ